MKTFTTWLVLLLALTAAFAAQGQEQPELQTVVTPAADGCNADWCTNGTFQAPTDQVSPTDWYALQLRPVLRADRLGIQQESAPSESREFSRMDLYPRIDAERSWAQDLARIQELRLITLWQNPKSKIFLGVNNDGFAGLNYSRTIRRKPKPSRYYSYGPASRPIGPLAPPLVHPQSLTYEKKDLSGKLETGSK